MRIGNKFTLVKIANEVRANQRGRSITAVSTERHERKSIAHPLDGHYVYVDSKTYPDICRSKPSVTLIQPVTSLAENHSIGITTKGNNLIISKPSTFEAQSNVAENRVMAASLKAIADAPAKNKFGKYNRRDLQ